ncbi:MAG: bacteriohopanetetrol glucosamine biosynthesis glycosyltransferase HpnI [Anaerolineae bacterium]|nr:bacteriohopanetetrol glucosamine biosynthesis glycosyltransferase HpnI [Anaerolineae bacterium]
MTSALLLLIVMSWAFWLVAWLCTYDFFHQAQAASRPDEGCQPYTPPVSILKPIKGVDPDAYECLLSFVRQDYPEYEVLIGVLDPDDPSVGLAARLQREYPQRVRLVVAEPIGYNNKVSILHALAEQARHPVLVVADSDMRVGPDYLRRVVAPLEDPAVALVTCAYVGDKAVTLTARLEALYMGATFLPMVMVARRYLNMRFATGATDAFRAADLERIGGFRALADYLADDFQLGHQLSRDGGRVVLSDYIPRAVLGKTTFRDQWHREVRWARCNRVSRPLEYPALLVTLAVPLALGLALANGFAAPFSWILVASLLIRWWVAWQVSGYTGDEATRRNLGLLPLRDGLTAAVWVAGGVGRSIQWRGQRYTLRPGGKLGPPQPSFVRTLLRRTHG